MNPKRWGTFGLAIILAGTMGCKRHQQERVEAEAEQTAAEAERAAQEAAQETREAAGEIAEESRQMTGKAAEQTRQAAGEIAEESRQIAGEIEEESEEAAGRMDRGVAAERTSSAEAFERAHEATEDASEQLDQAAGAQRKVADTQKELAEARVEAARERREARAAEDKARSQARRAFERSQTAAGTDQTAAPVESSTAAQTTHAQPGGEEAEAEEPEPRTARESPGRPAPLAGRAPAQQTLEGTIVSLGDDKVLVSSGGGPAMEIVLEPDTTVQIEGRPASQQELLAGSDVRITYRLVGAERIADTVESTGAAPATTGETGGRPGPATPPTSGEPLPGTAAPIPPM